MKKVVTLVLCITMLCSLCLLNANATLPVTEYVKSFQQTYEGVKADSTSSSYTGVTVSSYASLNQVDDEGNTVKELYLGGGAYDGGRRYSILQGYATAFSNFSSEYVMSFDVKPVKNTAGLYVEMDNSIRIVIYPGTFTDGEWNTLKFEKIDGVGKFYLKQKSAADDTYRELVKDVDYEMAENLGGSWGVISLDTLFMGLDKDENGNYTQESNPEYNMAELFDAKVYVDNIYVYSIVPKNGKNVVLTYDKEITMSAAKTYTDKRIDLGVSERWANLTTYFDAERTGGNAPVTFLISGKVCSQGINLVAQPNDVKYTYKADWYLPVGSTYFANNGVYRKAENSEVWEKLTLNQEYTLETVYGRGSHNIIVGYLEPTHHTYAAAYTYAEGDENTVWTISNVQYIKDKAGFTGEVAATETGCTATIDISAGTETVTPVVAVYDGGTLVDVNFTDITHTGRAILPLEYNAENPEIKLFVWQSLGEDPLIDVTDITSWVK